MPLTTRETFTSPPIACAQWRDNSPSWLGQPRQCCALARNERRQTHKHNTAAQRFHDGNVPTATRRRQRAPSITCTVTGHHPVQSSELDIATFESCATPNKREAHATSGKALARNNNRTYAPKARQLKRRLDGETTRQVGSLNPCNFAS